MNQEKHTRGCNKTQMRQKSRLEGAKDEIFSDTNDVLTGPKVALRTFFMRAHRERRTHTSSSVASVVS